MDTQRQYLLTGVAFSFLFAIDPQDNWRRKTEAGKMQ